MELMLGAVGGVLVIQVSKGLLGIYYLVSMVMGTDSKVVVHHRVHGGRFANYTTLDTSYTFGVW